MRFLIASTPVGPVGSGLGGGVEATLSTLATVLRTAGHEVTAVVPRGSRLSACDTLEADGAAQVSQAGDRRAGVSMAYQSSLAAMWELVRQHQADTDVVVNLAYDWLPYYLAKFLAVPVKHLVSMAALNDGMRQAVRDASTHGPTTVAMHTRAQAATFDLDGQCEIIGYGLDVSDYRFKDEGGESFCWVGRVAREKGLEDAVAAVVRRGGTLRVLGAMEDPSYWSEVIARFPGARVQYGGFLSRDELQNELGRCAALIGTPKWVEALGIAYLEAMACGLPVVAYRRGGPAEFVRDGVTGWLVPPDDVGALTEALGRVATLDRRACRRTVEEDFSTEKFAERVRKWLEI